MRYISDFHIHSKFSRATSKEMDLENLAKWAKIKGIQILGTGDFTHPKWFKELKEKLELAENGLYKLKSKIRNCKQETNFIRMGAFGLPKPKAEARYSDAYFIPTSEISCIYSKNKKVRRIHLIVFAPNLETVEKINKKLGQKYNLSSDGRPILGIDAKELSKIILDISQECLIIPSHAWTPWFSIFGSKSGFDSIEECFEELTPCIYSIETGLSSDPLMNWRLSALDKITLISNSDAHSPANLGREANVFEIAENKNLYQEIIKILKTKDKKRFLYTIEFFPEEGKYHFDGHRLCGVCLTPGQTKKNNGLCPKCKRPLTVGVMSRVEELADRPENFLPENRIPFKSLIPLAEIIAQIFKVGKNSLKVKNEYLNLIKKAGSEFKILIDLSEEELLKITLPEIVQSIIKMRKREVIKEPGYDGVYGKIKIIPEQQVQEKLW